VRNRLPVLVVLLAVVVGGAVLDRDDDRTPDAAAAPEIATTAFPMTPADSAVTSSWFCAGGTADEEGFADHVVTMLNTTGEPLGVELTVFPGIVAPPVVDPDAEELDPEEDGAEEDGAEAPAEVADVPDEPIADRLQIGPRSRVRIALSDIVTAPVASALVESAGAGLVVEHEVSSIHGIDAKPCATAASDVWHFAWGTTAREARQLLVLFNPFPDDAIVEGVFSTEDTVREPGRFAGGLVVPARSTVGIDLGDDVTRRDEVAATLRTRAGRIVVDRIVRVDEEGGERGLTVQLGVPEPQLAWVYPDGLVSETVSQTFVVYNPTDELAEADIAFILDRAQELGVPEPVELSIPPGDHVTVDMGEDGRLPAGVPHSAVVRSANGVPIVAERVVGSRDRVRRGLTVSTGSPVEATEWTFAAGTTEPPAAQSLTMVNLDPQVITEVDVFALVGGREVPVSELQDLVIEAGERRNVDLTARIPNRPDLAIVVRASEPIVVERVLAQTGSEQRGISLAVGIPAPEGRRAPVDPVESGASPAADDLDDLPTEGDDGDVPSPPEDVELPEPDETIVIDDPDAEATVPDEDDGDGGGGGGADAGDGSG
jgi:hypothetical protein